MRARHTDRTRTQRGFALISVLLVLLALLVLCAPFMMTARNASKASTQLADRSQARLALDSAARNARAHLGRTHPARDETPYWDDAGELAIDEDFAPEFLNARNPEGVMFDAEVSDVAAAIDWNSAPPHLFANALDATTRLVAPLKKEDKDVSVSTTWGFPKTGYLWIGRELVSYADTDPQKFKRLTRGIGAVKKDDGKYSDSGPQPASDHAPSTIVIDQRAYAPVLWRTNSIDGAPLNFDAPEQLRDCAQLAPGLDAEAKRRVDEEEQLAEKEDREREFNRDRSLARARRDVVDEFIAKVAEPCSTYAGVRGGRAWSKPTRVRNELRAGLDDKLQVDDFHDFNPGATVQLTDGASTELGIVVEVDLQRGIVRLLEPVANGYAAFAAEARALTRRPVNVNLAPKAVLELLFANLQLAGKNERITRDEAEALAALVVASRPFTGFEDFLRRIVLPASGIEKLPEDAPVRPAELAGGGTLIDTLDAAALYANALNANDARLAYATMPLAFTSRNVFDFELRSVVNAPSGVERLSLLRETVEMVVPQRDLMNVWARQEDWDELLRLDREAPWWSTGPNATSMFDGGSPPSRLVPHLGTFGGRMYLPGLTKLEEGEAAPAAAEHTFASREDYGWAQLWASRVDEMGPRAGRVEHFDAESRDPEGRYLPDQIVKEATKADRVGWTTADDPYLRALDFSFWLKPRPISDGTLLDIGVNSLETDRVQLVVETTAQGQDLVLRVFDAAGDLSATTFREVGETRFSLAPGDGPGFAEDTWSHVSIDVSGTRPSQMSMLVDGRAFGVRTLGLTRLLGGLNPNATGISVETTEGFPDRGVLRIGNELIEYKKQSTTGNVFDASPQLTGPEAGFGGRYARVPFTVQAGEPGAPEPSAVANITGQYDEGTPVELYGYAAALETDILMGNAPLPEDLGAFAIGMVASVIGGSTAIGDPVDLRAFPTGWLGMDGANSQVSGLVLEVVDPTMPPETMMKAFCIDGGYAALVQAGGDNYRNGVQQTTDITTPAGSQIFGVEIVKYSGWSGTTLNIIQRAALQAGQRQQVPHAFVTDFGGWFTIDDGVLLNNRLTGQLFVVPISIPAPGSNAQAAFPKPANGVSEFAQITRGGEAEANGQAELTEWVRYDTVTPDSHLVRNSDPAINALILALTHDADGVTDDDSGGPPPGGGGPPSNIGLNVVSAPPPPASSAPAAAQQSGQPYLWQQYWGSAEDDDWLVTRAARTAFQFRGVGGTYSHAHPAGTQVLPVWRIKKVPEGGEPGRFDDVTLMQEDATLNGSPGRIHRSWRPYDHTVSVWAPDPTNLLLPATSTDTAALEDMALINRGVNCALDAPARIPIFLPTATTGGNPIFDSRLLPRVLKHPSGERPRICENVFIGGTLRGEGVPTAVVDELVWGSTEFTGQQPTQGSQLMLTQKLATGGGDLRVAPDAVRLAWSTFAIDDVTNELPDDAGLLRVADEILCYSSVDPTSGAFVIPPNGRGLLGTVARAHEPGETVTFLHGWTVSVLAGQINASSSALPLVDTADFPQSGTVLVDGELIHYTRVNGQVLEMPSRSETPGAKDGEGDGIFRGRYGTSPAGHAGLSPVILFPFRYWDRWSDRCDAPELSYIAPCVDQPNAFWRNVFWSTDEARSGGARIEVLQRLVTYGAPPPPWDGDPQATPGLKLLTDGQARGQGNPIADFADLIEWRAFVRFQPNAFDATNGLSHGWKETPRLRAFGVDYAGPNLVLRRLDR